MRRCTITFRSFLACAALTTLGPPVAAAAQATEAPPATVVYLVRHAETTGEAGGDAPLSAVGERRAALLAGTLADAGITRVFTTPYRRTIGTAAAVGGVLGLEVERYDPRQPAALLAAVRGGGRRLVVGHSNTVPDLVEALGGDPGSPIAEDEHDRLYVVVLGGDGVTTTLLRYGNAGDGGSLNTEPAGAPRVQAVRDVGFTMLEAGARGWPVNHRQLEAQCEISR